MHQIQSYAHKHTQRAINANNRKKKGVQALMYKSKESTGEKKKKTAKKKRLFFIYFRKCHRPKKKKREKRLECREWTVENRNEENKRKRTSKKAAHHRKGEFRLQVTSFTTRVSITKFFLCFASWSQLLRWRLGVDTHTHTHRNASPFSQRRRSRGTERTFFFYCCLSLLFLFKYHSNTFSVIYRGWEIEELLEFVKVKKAVFLLFQRKTSAGKPEKKKKDG